MPAFALLTGARIRRYYRSRKTPSKEIYPWWVRVVVTATPQELLVNMAVVGGILWLSLMAVTIAIALELPAWLPVLIPTLLAIALVVASVVVIPIWARIAHCSSWRRDFLDQGQRL